MLTSKIQRLLMNHSMPCMSICRLNAVAKLTLFPLALLLAMLVAIGFGCGQKSENIPLRLGINSWVGYDPFVIAKEYGDLERLGWRLVESTSNVDSARGLRNGTLDAAAMTLDEALNLIHEGAEISIVLALSVSNGADVVLARPEWEIDSLSEAKSVVAFENTTLSRLVLTRFIEKLKLDSASFKTQIFTAENHEKAYSSKEFDLIVTYEPIASRLEKLGAKRVFDSSQMDSEIFDVLVVNRDALKNNLERISQLIGLWESGLRILNLRDAEALKWLSQGGELELEEYVSVLEKLNFFNLDASISILKQAESGQSGLSGIVQNYGDAVGTGSELWTPEFLESSIDVGPLLNAIRHNNNQSIDEKD